jgi:hypothetical protein
LKTASSKKSNNPMFLTVCFYAPCRTRLIIYSHIWQRN